MIELLVVIAVIALLVTLVALVGTHVAYAHKKKITENTMRTIHLAIDQFVQTNPLANFYDQKDAATFGAYPPYMLAGDDNGGAAIDNVRKAVERYAAYSPPPGSFSYVLVDRLHRDLGNRQGNYRDWVGLRGPDSNDDIRALYAYLRVYASGLLAQVPSAAMKVLPADAAHPQTPGAAEGVNPTGTGPAAGQPGTNWVDVLGFYDAWGVPLDYFLYVKLELKMVRGGGTGGEWRVTDRRPALRSLGISREEYEAEAAGTDALDPDRWILSEPFPQPICRAVSVPKTGEIGGPLGSQTAGSGWTRAVAAGEEDTYLP